MTQFSAPHIRVHLTTEIPRFPRRKLSIAEYHRAGVLVPLIQVAGTYDLLFMKRTDSVETHKGQISFPGGMMDDGDSDIVQTALREAHEELGINPADVTVVGSLDDLATPSRFVITPVVGLIEVPPLFVPNTTEVADVFQVPLEFFADPENGRVEIRRFKGENHEVWFYESGSHTIWGATAMIIRSLLRILGAV